MVAKFPSLRELRFGSLDAAEEAIYDPHLLKEGYFDYKDAAYGIGAGDVWFVLGIKGAGKSAVLEHLKLSWADQWDRFIDVWNLQDFPVANVSLMRTGETTNLARAQAAWQLILLLRVLDLLDGDQGLSASYEFQDLLRQLKKERLVGDGLRGKVIEWSTTRFTVKFPFGELGIDKRPAELSVEGLLRRIQGTIKSVKTDSQHLLALDGLDQFFFDADEEWSALAGLTYAIAALNKFFRTLRLRITIVAAIRSDIFDVLPAPDANKMKPHSVVLDWSEKGIGAGNQLWQLVTAKARVDHPEVPDIVKTYLATPIYLGPHTAISEYFLDHTRLLPRDLVALLGYLQQVKPGSGQVTEQAAKDTVRRYCDEYFQGEVFNSLAGVLPTGKARALSSFRDAVRTVPTRCFSFEDVQSELQGELEESETKALLKQMFEVGGIGIRNASGSAEHTDFVFRRVSRAGFTMRYGFMLHNALTRAWNRPWK
jgi:hypothetical protein